MARWYWDSLASLTSTRMAGPVGARRVAVGRTLFQVRAVQQDSDWTVVDQMHLHRRPEGSRAHWGEAGFAERDEPVEQLGSWPGRQRGEEIGPPSLAAIRVQRELRH